MEGRENFDCVYNVCLVMSIRVFKKCVSKHAFQTHVKIQKLAAEKTYKWIFFFNFFTHIQTCNLILFQTRISQFYSQHDYLTL